MKPISTAFQHAGKVTREECFDAYQQLGVIKMLKCHMVIYVNYTRQVPYSVIRIEGDEQ